MTIVDPEKLQLAGKFILALKQFSSVKDACFGQYLDVQNYENYIKQFLTTYRSLPIRAGPQSQKWSDQQITLNPTGSDRKSVV